MFKLTPSNGGWAESVLYSFTGQSDGGTPFSGVILDNAGNLYGTTEGYGYSNCGTAFQLTPSGAGWMENTLHAFGVGGNDGCHLWGGLILQSGYLYGSTASGGSTGSGNPLLPYHKWRSLSAESFNGPAESGPEASLTMDAAGNLYGTTSSGGMFGYGSVFKGVQTSLYNFTGGSNGKIFLSATSCLTLMGTSMVPRV